MAGVGFVLYRVKITSRPSLIGTRKHRDKSCVVLVSGLLADRDLYLINVMIWFPITTAA